MGHPVELKFFHHTSENLRFISISIELGMNHYFRSEEKTSKGSSHSKKEKKVVNFHNWGRRGVIPKFWHFHNFFFACSNSSKSAIKFFCKGGRGTPWPIYFENLDDYQLNIDFFQSFFGFSRENFSYFAHSGFLVME